MAGHIRNDTSWCRAVCTRCGQRYYRARWKKRWKTGAVGCAICAKDGIEYENRLLWVVPNRQVAEGIRKMDKAAAQRFAKWQLTRHKLGI